LPLDKSSETEWRDAGETAESNSGSREGELSLQSGISRAVHENSKCASVSRAESNCGNSEAGSSSAAPGLLPLFEASAAPGLLGLLGETLVCAGAFAARVLGMSKGGASTGKGETGGTEDSVAYSSGDPSLERVSPESKPV